MEISHLGWLPNTRWRQDGYYERVRTEPQGPEELNLYARIILRTSYHIKYITKSFDQ